MRMGSFDLVAYFDRNRKHICVLFSIMMLTNFVVANNMEERSLLSGENILRIMAIAMSPLALTTNNRAVNRTVLITAWVLLVVHFVFFN